MLELLHAGVEIEAFLLELQLSPFRRDSVEQLGELVVQKIGPTFSKLNDASEVFGTLRVEI